MGNITKLYFLTLISAVLVLSGCSEYKDYSKQIEVLDQFCREYNANSDYYYLIDFSIHSGKKRMFLYDRKNKKIIRSYMVSHGSGNGERNGVPITFSNQINNHCTSLGVALINGRDYSNWGTHVKYWLDGLEESNSNMRKRIVVLHSYEGVSNEEVYPSAIMNSQGCPMVSIEAMQEIDEFIQKQDNKKILIYSFNGL